MTRKMYVETCLNDSDRSSCDDYYSVEIVIGTMRFIPSIDSGGGSYETRTKANKMTRQIATRLGIEAKFMKKEDE